MSAGPAGVPPNGTLLDASAIRWESWSLYEVAARLVDIRAPWAFAAGWAIDLFLGRSTREHEDVEVAIPSSVFPAVRAAMAPYEFELVGSGLSWQLGDDVAFAATHQTWLRNPSNGAYVLDVFREPHEVDVWICRRDSSIRRHYSEVVKRDADGLPYVAPEIVLLFKARLMRDKDWSDFEDTLPLMDEPARAWLALALERIHPGHVWIERLT